MRTTMNLITAMECGACLRLIDGEPNLKDLVSQEVNSPLTVFLFLVQHGCCPLCGQDTGVSGQTKDAVIERYIAIALTDGGDL